MRLSATRSRRSGWMLCWHGNVWTMRWDGAKLVLCWWRSCHLKGGFPLWVPAGLLLMKSRVVETQMLLVSVSMNVYVKGASDAVLQLCGRSSCFNRGTVHWYTIWTATVAFAEWYKNKLPSPVDCWGVVGLLDIARHAPGMCVWACVFPEPDPPTTTSCCIHTQIQSSTATIAPTTALANTFPCLHEYMLKITC